jgi:hypothetical protein
MDNYFRYKNSSFKGENLNLAGFSEKIRKFLGPIFLFFSCILEAPRYQILIFHKR